MLSGAGSILNTCIAKCRIFDSIIHSSLELTIKTVVRLIRIVGMSFRDHGPNVMEQHWIIMRFLSFHPDWSDFGKYFSFKFCFDFLWRQIYGTFEKRRWTRQVYHLCVSKNRRYTFKKSKLFSFHSHFEKLVI